MNTGRSAHQYQSIALLYLWSQRLQLHLAGYFIVVVGFLHMLFRLAQKSIIRQFVATADHRSKITSESPTSKYPLHSTTRSLLSWLILLSAILHSIEFLRLFQTLQAAHNISNCCVVAWVKLIIRATEFRLFFNDALLPQQCPVVAASAREGIDYATFDELNVR